MEEVLAHANISFFEDNKMKKNSKHNVRDYSKYDAGLDYEYYGVFKSKGRIKVDTKRYEKFFTLPDEKVKYRNTAYYMPSKRHYGDYICNIFRGAIASYKNLFNTEYKNIIDSVKTPQQVADETRTYSIMDGILDIDEATMTGRMAGIRRTNEYYYVIAIIYSQFFTQFMADLDAVALKTMVSEGYSSKSFSREQFDVFIQGKQGKNAISFFDYDNYHIYEEAYLVWNFLKHNSSKAYDKLIKKYPDRIIDPESKYQNGDSALSVLNFNKEYILYVIDNLSKFFDEVCVRGFHENVEDASWDYDDYFESIVASEIDCINNPLGLPDYI